MNTPDTEKCEYCSAREQEHGYGVICEHATPDTEWERQLRIDFEVAYGSMPKNFEHVPSVHISDWWLEKLSSRDTYWQQHEKEMYESLDKEYQLQVEHAKKKEREERDTYWKEREKYVPRFKGINIFSKKEVTGAGCYTSERGSCYILEDNKGEEPIFTPVEQIDYDWYTPINKDNLK